MKPNSNAPVSPCVSPSPTIEETPVFTRFRLKTFLEMERARPRSFDPEDEALFASGNRNLAGPSAKN
ncbi:MAG: hypothetical protein AAF191_02705 [Verrucomicrobiota bacterium]